MNRPRNRYFDIRYARNRHFLVSFIVGAISTAVFSIMAFIYGSQQRLSVMARLSPRPASNVSNDSTFSFEPSKVELMKSKIKSSEIWMGDLEVHLALNYLQNVNRYLEWGSGGSTLNFAPFAKERAVSIEHNDGWCAKLRVLISQRQNLSKLEYHCVPKEHRKATRGYTGSAVHKDGSYVSYRKYVDKITEVATVTEEGDAERFDFVLVDGRSRVDCAIRALSFIHTDSVVVLHDSSRITNQETGGENIYYPVTKYYRILHLVGGEEKQGIAIMQRKKEFNHLEGDHEAVQKLLQDKYRLKE